MTFCECCLAICKIVITGTIVVCTIIYLEIRKFFTSNASVNSTSLEPLTGSINNKSI